MRNINPIDNHGSIQLKFTVSGKRYSFHPITGGVFGNPRDMATARAIATRIENDRLAGFFDPTLDRYRLEPKPVPVVPVVSLLDQWDSWVCSLDLSPATQASHYEWVRRQIAKAKPDLFDTAWFTGCKLSPSTYNHRLSYLRSCLEWTVRQGKASVNPWKKVKVRREDKVPLQPFSPKEIVTLCEGFKTMAPSYMPLVSFLFLTGCRLSEAIGLRWSDVDLQAGVMTIASSLPIDRTGNGYRRTRKATKTGNIRYLDIPENLAALLKDLAIAADGLVFHSPKGYVVSSQAFRRVWVRVLKAAGVPYRRLHIIRHTVLSMAVEQGTPLTGVAYLAGHRNTRMVIETYGHMINRPSLPNVDLGPEIAL